MFCLDCGQKISENDKECPKCGLLVSEMRERIARAEEMVTYAETIGPASTQKMPPVPERTYKDKDGNVFHPEEKISIPVQKTQKNTLDSIPQIGSSDPYMTMPIKKVVSEKGEIVVDVDREQKIYAQNHPKKSIWTVKKVVLVVLLVVLLAAASVFGYMNIFSASNQGASNQGNNVESVSLDQAENTSSSEESSQTDISQQIVDVLSDSYTGLDASYAQLRECINEFEGYFLLVDRDSRTSHAQGIFDLRSEVSANQEALAKNMADLNVNEASPYYQQYQAIDALYDDLLERISVIASCWDISLSYDDPRDNSQEILAPLAEDLAGGESVSESAYLSLYPEAQPHLL